MGLLDEAIREHLELKRRRGADAGDISRQESEALGPVRRGPDGAPDLPDTFIPPSGTPSEEPGSVPSWRSDEPVSAAGRDVVDEPPPAPPSYEPPPTAAYEPPAPPPYEPPPTTAYEPPAPPPYEPPPTSAYEPPTAAPYEPPPTRSPDGDHAFEPPPEPDEPEPDEPHHEHSSLLARLRIGRKGTRHDSPSRSGRDDPPEPYKAPSPEGQDPTRAAPPDAPVDDVLEETPDFLEETPEHDRLWFEQRPPRDFDFDDK